MAKEAREAPILHTVEDFLDWAERQDGRWEFYDGSLQAMAGGTVAHGRISTNALLRLGESLRGGPCRPNDSTTSVLIDNTGLLPDVTVTCAPERGRGLHNPIVIVEVLSPMSEADDRGRKWVLYRTLPGLRHYLMLAQDRVAGELYSRDEEGANWRFTLLQHEDATVDLTAVNVRLRLGDLYEDVIFEPIEPGPGVAARVE